MYRYIVQLILHYSLLWTSCLRFLTKSHAIPQQLYKTAARSLSATAELLVLYNMSSCLSFLYTHVFCHVSFIFSTFVFFFYGSLWSETNKLIVWLIDNTVVQYSASLAASSGCVVGGARVNRCSSCNYNQYSVSVKQQWPLTSNRHVGGLRGRGLAGSNLKDRRSFLKLYNQMCIGQVSSCLRLSRLLHTYQSINWANKDAYDTIRYDSGYLTCSKKLTGSQLSLPHALLVRMPAITVDVVLENYHGRTWQIKACLLVYFLVQVGQCI